MNTKQLIRLVVANLLLLLTFTSCFPEEEIFTVEYDINDLYGKWRSGTDYYVYNADGTGYCWDEGEDISEDEAQPFTWTVDESEMIHIHKMEMGSDVPMYYIITELTPQTLKYYDAYKTSDKYSFIKVQ